jgi:hypothetical protein
MSESGRFSDNHTDTGATVPAGRELFDPTIVELSGCTPPVLGEHFGKVATPLQSHAKDALGDRFFDHETFLPPPAEATGRAALDGGQPTAYGLLSCP